MESDHENVAVALAELARQVRESTLSCLRVTEPSLLTWTPPGTSNHILWHGGHALWVQDVLTIQQLTGKSQLPEGWAATFGQHSEPAKIHSWPSDHEVRDLLGRQLSRIVDLLSEHYETIHRWVIELHNPHGYGSPLRGMVHGWQDEARHQGEMHLLLKQRRATT